jgi:hypothetical protein
MPPTELTVDDLLQELAGEVVDTVQPYDHGSVVSPLSLSGAPSPTVTTDSTSAPAVPFIRPVTDTGTPLWDDNLKASLLRQGKYGLTRREQRRKRKFATPADLAWPVPYHNQPANDYAAKRMGFLVGMAYRIMRAQDLTPGPTSPLERPSIPEGTREQLEDILYAVAAELGEDYIVHQVTHNGKWVTATNKTTRKNTGDEKKNSYKTTNGQVTYATLEKEVEHAVEFAWDGWQDDYLTKRSEMGRKGGLISKRGPAYDYTLVRQWDGYSDSIVAEKLGWSRGTVRKARKETQGYGRPTPVSR